MPLSDFINTQYHSFPQLRLAILPFSVPANIARIDNEHEGWGNEIAWDMQAQILASGKVSIVEVFNPREWPGKHEEFYTGNHTAISLAQAAGYDLLLVGVVEPFKAATQASAVAKLIDVNSSVTVWYGRSQTGKREFNTRHGDPFFITSSHRPDDMPSSYLKEDLTRCLVENVLSDNPVP